MAILPRYEEQPTSVDPESIKKFQKVRQCLAQQQFPLCTDAGMYEREMVAPPQTNLFLLWANAELLELRSVGFGGTTSPTADGLKVAELLAQVVAANKSRVVVSGGVIGIDQAAHIGALDSKGKTIAVLANPVQYGLHPYVPHRSFLEEGIRENGSGLLSEYEQWADRRGARLKERDRIISALSDIFVAVECSEGSDTVDTAKRCKIQGHQAVAINWNKIKLTWHHQPNREGGDYLIRAGWARPFPPEDGSEPMSIEDSRFTQLFEQLIEWG